MSFRISWAEGADSAVGASAQPKMGTSNNRSGMRANGGEPGSVRTRIIMRGVMPHLLLESQPASAARCVRVAETAVPGQRIVESLRPGNGNSPTNVVGTLRVPSHRMHSCRLLLPALGLTAREACLLL